MKSKRLSAYKYKKFAEESLKNALRFHIDSMILFKNHSYPSAFQLSILALEELAKAKWVDHVYYSTITNNGFPKENDEYYEEHVKFEQEWLNMLFQHPIKQKAFVGPEIFDFSPKFVNKINEKKLEFQKQQATYVGLKRSKGNVDTTSRISVPVNKIKSGHAKQIISLLNHEFRQIYNLIIQQDGYWGICEMDDIINKNDYPQIFGWQHRSGLKSRRWNKLYFAKYS